MSNKLHSSIFLAFLIVFITVAPLALLYSEGYRFNFDDNEVVKTGGLSFKVEPQVRAEIYLDGELEKKANRWTYSAYLNALSPDNYQVKIQKEGYHPWQKTLKVKEGKVTEAKHVLMVPKKPKLKTQLSNVGSFFVSPDENKISYRDSDQKLHFYNIEEESEIPFNRPASTFVKWGPESERALIRATDTHFIFHDQEFTEEELPSDLEEIHFNPGRPTELFYTRESRKKLFKTDYAEKNSNSSSTIINFLAYDFSPQGIIWLSSSGQVHRSDFSGTIQKTFNSEPLPIQEKDYQIIEEGGKILILEGETLYTLTQEGEFKQLATDVNQIKLSPYVQKAALVSDYEIDVVYLNEQYGQPRREKYDQDFITRFSQPIEKVSWFDSHHLIFNLEESDKIKISGIDNRGRINMVDYLTSESDRWYWNNNREVFYLLENGTLYQNSPLKT